MSFGETPLVRRTLATMFAVFAALALSVGVPGAADAGLDRVPDVVEVSGLRLSALNGVPLGQLGLFAWRDGAWQPIPYQIDERTPDGDYVFSGGPEANPKEGTGNLKRRDELVFMASDAGALAADGPWPEGAEKGVRIQVVDVEAGVKAWVYLFRFPDLKHWEVLRSEVDYARYEPGSARVTTPNYVMEYHPGEDVFPFSRILVPRTAGGTGTNFYDQMKMRIHLRTLLWFSLNFDEEEWESTLVRYLDGPIRVIRQVRNRLTFFGVDVAPELRFNATYYRDYHAVPSVLHQTLNVQALAREGWVRFSVDFRENAKGMRYYRPSAHGPGRWYSVDGRMDSDEVAMPTQAPHWHMISGAPGTLILRVRMPEPVVTVTKLFYADNESRRDAPDQEPGSVGEFGYEFDLMELPQGTYDLEAFWIFISKPQPGDEVRYQLMLDDPLDVRVRNLDVPTE